MIEEPINIEEKIDEIQKLASELKTDDLKELEKVLDQLRIAAYQIDSHLRTIKENAAEEKVHQIIQAGFRFDAIVVDDFRFYHDENDKLNKGYCRKYFS